MKSGNKVNIALIMSLISLFVIGCQPEVKNSAAADSSMENTAEATGNIQKSAPQISEKSGVKAQMESAAEAPKIVMKKDKHDFGDVGPGSSNIAHFEFVNEGNATLLVKQIQSTCGCSQPTLIKDGQRYDAKIAFPEPIPFEPGEAGQVEVTFRAPTVKGEVTKHLYVVSNNPDITRAELEIKARVSVKVSITPEVVDLQLDQENAGMPELVVEGLDDSEFSISSATSSNKAITIPFDSTEKAKKFVLKPHVDIDQLGAITTGTIQVSTTHPQSGRLLVRYTVKPRYELSNPRYFLQNIEPGQAISRENLIRSNYGKKVEIESAASRNGYMDIESQEYEGDNLKLAIRISPPAKDADTRRFFSDILTIQLKDGYSLEIRATGYFKTN